MRRAGRAVRARVRRPARQPVVRRRAGLAHVLRARPDRPAAPARRLPVDDAAGREGLGRAVRRTARCSTWSSSTARRAASSAATSITGALERHAAHAVLLCTGGYGTAYYLSTNAVNSNVTAAWRAHKRGAFFANPCYTQIHPTCIPVSGTHQSKLTLMSESLRNDGRVWVPKTAGRQAAAAADPRSGARLLPRAEVSELRQPRAARRRVAQRQGRLRRGARRRRERPRGLSRFRATRSSASARDVIKARYGNLFDMYRKITDEDPYQVPMRIYPAIHYTMGGLWVDYNLMSNVPGLHVLGEANFSDHGANRLGASALMQGLADGYFVIPYTLAHYLGGTPLPAVSTDHDAFKEAEDAVQQRIDALLRGQGHRDAAPAAPRARPAALGRRRHGAERRRACGGAGRDSASCASEFWQNLSVPGDPNNLNKNLEYAGRVADYLEFAETARARRAAPHRIVRRPLPRGEPDARRRGAARRRELLLRGGVGVQGRRRAAGAAQGAAALRVREAVAAELQVELADSHRLRSFVVIARQTCESH